MDLGSGDGRDVLFLQDKGFHVTAVDKNQNALGILTEKASGKTDLRNTDISVFITEKDSHWDNIISFWTLHFLRSEEAKKVYDWMKKHTKSGGINVVADFTKDGPFYNLETMKKDLFYLDLSQLRGIYKDWEILFYKEKEVFTKAGSKQTAAFVVAKKP